MVPILLSGTAERAALWLGQHVLFAQHKGERKRSIKNNDKTQQEVTSSLHGPVNHFPWPRGFQAHWMHWAYAERPVEAWVALHAVLCANPMLDFRWCRFPQELPLLSSELFNPVSPGRQCRLMLLLRFAAVCGDADPVLRG